MVITEREKLGHLQDQSIWKVKKTETLAYSRTLTHLTEKQVGLGYSVRCNYLSPFETLYALLVGNSHFGSICGKFMFLLADPVRFVYFFFGGGLLLILRG